MKRLTRYPARAVAAVIAVLLAFSVSACAADPVHPDDDGRYDVVVLGDSIAFGAGPHGSSVPKDQHSWPADLRRALDARRETSGGTGWVIMNQELVTHPEWDSHVRFGAGVTLLDEGLHRAAAIRLKAGSPFATIDFTAEAEEFRVWTLRTGGAPVPVLIDGEPVGTITNGEDEAATLPAERGSVGTQEITRIPTSRGEHVLTIEAPERGSAVVLAIEGRTLAEDAWVISNASINGRSLSTLFAGPNRNDERRGRYGLPLIDGFRADLLVIALGTNDWHRGATRVQMRDWLVRLIQRQQRLGGEAMLLLNPRPSVDEEGFPTYRDTARVPWEQLREAYREAAGATGARLLDLGGLFGDYAQGKKDGLFSDPVHPSDLGAQKIADAVERALLGDEN